MKVGDKSNTAPGISEIMNKDDKKLPEEITKNNFNDKLKMFGDKNFEEKIQLLVGKIFEQGEKLGKKIDIRELKIYKKLMTEFMDEAVNNSHKFSKENFLDKRGRHRVYAVIKTINKELDELTKDVLESEKDHLKILNKLEDIRGLIMDIVM